jgi:hypothetical protein
MRLTDNHAASIRRSLYRACKARSDPRRFGLVAAEIGFHTMRDLPAVGEVDPTPSVSHAELDAATQVLKGKLLAGREAGFRNILRVNFPDDEIKAMAGGYIGDRVPCPR